MVIGPALAGVLIALTGPGEAIAIDSLTFVVSALFLARLRPAELTAARRGGGRPARSSSTACARAGRSCATPGWILPGIGALVAYTVFVLPSIFVLGPGARRAATWTARRAWAIIATAFGVGAVVGSVRRLPRAVRAHARRVLRARCSSPARRA